LIMDLGLQGKVAIVTGATRGIGQAISRVLLDEGASVLGTGRSHASIEGRAVENFGGRLQLTVCDLFDPSAPAALIDTAQSHFGRLDIVVNNAASSESRSLAELNRDDWNSLVTQKLIASAEIIRAAIPYLALSHQGAVVNIAGLTGWIPVGESPRPGAVNAGILNMTEFFASRLASQGIRVNSVSPGDTRTDRREERLRKLQDVRGISRALAENEMTRLIPLGRAVEPEEVGVAVAMLCSSRLGSVTGVNFLVDGGWRVGR
jgi:3-oxoacyl-[acyl-carrier protein] reductase